jgi:ketosteroid isomerase-like protein
VSSDAAGVIRGLTDAAAARDYERVREYFARDAVWFGTRGGIDEDQVVRGPDAAVRYLREIQETWQRFDVEIEQIVEVGDAAVAFLRERGIARHAELEVDNATAVVFVVRGGQISEATGYLDRDEALAAARRRAPG